MNEVEKQILTNQLCILATLKTIGKDKLYFIQQQNIDERIEETKKLRDKKRRKN